MAYWGNEPAKSAVKIGDDVILSSHIDDGVIVNADINASAAIATSKISGALTSVAGSHGLGSLAALSTIASAQITDGTIVNADINASAAIAYSKLGTIPTFNQNTTGQAGTVATIAGLAPNTATTQATQGAITSLGTLTTLTVDNVIINGTTIGHTSDTDLLTLASAKLTVAGQCQATSFITGDLILKSPTNNGHYTIWEEEDYLAIRNELKGKTYKFVLEEIE